MMAYEEAEEVSPLTEATQSSSLVSPTGTSSSDENSAQSWMPNEREATANRVRQVVSLLQRCLSRADQGTGAEGSEPLAQGQQVAQVADLADDLDEVERCAKNLDLVIQLGDYAGRIWKCLLRASHFSLAGSVASLSRAISQKEDEIEVNTLDSLRAAIETLVQDRVEIDEGTAREAIKLYADRNLICHTDNGTRSALHKDAAGLEELLRSVDGTDERRNSLRRMVKLWEPANSWLRRNTSVLDHAPEEQDSD